MNNKISVNQRFKTELVNAILECAAMRDRHSRDAVVDELPPGIKTTVRRHSADKVDVMNIVSRCADFEDGLTDLIRVVENFEGPSLPMKKVWGIFGKNEPEDIGAGENPPAFPGTPFVAAPMTGNGNFGLYTQGEPIFKDYVLKRHIGEGGFGRVYLVKNKIDKAFALKVLFRGAVGEKRGVESVLRIRSNRLVSVLDYGETTKGEFCVLMEYMKNNFAAVLDGGKLEENRARHYFREILEGLRVLEQHRILHRDIKPSNLFTQEDVVKIGDFGTAKYTAGETSTKTRTLGTIKYCAPECFENHYAFSVDRWAATVVFYRMLTGRYPYEGEHSTAVFGAIIGKTPDYSAIPDKYSAFFRKCFEKNPSHRFADALEMIRAFDETGSDEQKIREYETRIKNLETERDLLERIVSNRQGDEITIHAGGNVAFAKDQAEARAGVEELENEIERISRILEKTESDKLNNESETPKTQLVKPKANRKGVSEKHQLRSEPLTLSEDDVRDLIKKHNFFCKKDEWTEKWANESGNFENNFADNGDGTITDHATGLMWQQSGSDKDMPFKDAPAYVDRINREKLDDHDDWRLPTIEELASLIESKKQNGRYIDPVFEKKAFDWFWSSDKRAGGGVWYVIFNLGLVNWFNENLDSYVRLVRRGQ